MFDVVLFASCNLSNEAKLLSFHVKERKCNIVSKCFVKFSYSIGCATLYGHKNGRCGRVHWA